MPPPAEVLKLHHSLLCSLDKTFSPESDEFKWLKRHCRSYLLAGVVDRCKNMDDLAEKLQNAGKIKIGDYATLKDMMRGSDSNVGFAVETIEEIEQKIKKVYEAESENQKKSKERRLDSDSLTGTDSPATSSREAAANSSDSGGSLNKTTYSKGNGLCLILNIFRRQREGTVADMKRLTSFLKDVNCEVNEQEDLTRDEVLKCLQDYQEYLQKSIPKYAYFICAIMSHGDEEGIITYDDKRVTMNEIMDYFKNDRMGKFVGKPKMFLVQACRGPDLQHGHAVSDDEPTDVSTMLGEMKIPTDADVLLVHATTPGNKAWRRVYEGSWFFCELVNLLREHYRDEHLEEILISLRENVALNYVTHHGAKQMPCTWSTLTKRFYFC